MITLPIHGIRKVYVKPSVVSPPLLYVFRLILESLSGGISSLNADSLVEERDESPFEDVEEFRDFVDEEYIDSLDVTSGFFRVTTVIQVGTTQFTMYSLLERSLAGQSTPVLRTFGAE